MRNIKTNRPSKKLDYTKTGPFNIEKQLGPVTFKLELPDNIKIHPVFHAALLEPAYTTEPSRPNPETHPDTEEPEYEVEEIRARRQRRRKQQYLIKWKGYPDHESTWEPVRNLSHCQDLLHQYQQRTPAATRQRR